MAYAYGIGAGVDKDRVNSTEWLRKAAEQTYADAEYFLGLAYLYGNGVGKNKDQAMEWMSKAAVQGDVRAKLYLELPKQNAA